MDHQTRDSQLIQQQQLAASMNYTTLLFLRYIKARVENHTSIPDGIPKQLESQFDKIYTQMVYCKNEDSK